MNGRCDQCSSRLRGAGHKTSTRTLCDACWSKFMGAAAGVAAGGTVAGAVATAGWFQRMRDARANRRS